MLVFLSISSFVLSFDLSFFFFYCYVVHRDLHSFPTRRSSDLGHGHARVVVLAAFVDLVAEDLEEVVVTDALVDRKSTRLNSSHSQISYAVFCLKKKKKRIILDYTLICPDYGVTELRRLIPAAV